MHRPPLTIRPFGVDEITAATDLLAMVFAEDFTDADLEAERSVFEADRSLATFDGNEMVGCMSTYSFDMSVPGGSTPVAGTTWVGVLPTHRRRGVLSRMIRQHLADVAARGEALAALWASEAAIYGRFGYGPAIEALGCTIAVDGGLAWQHTAPPPASAVRLVPLAEAWEALDPIHEACRRRRAGMHRRSQAWWHFQTLSTRKSALQGASRKYVAVAEVDGRDAAYAVYGIRESGGDSYGRPDGQLQVIEMGGVDPSAEAAMWRYLLGHDLLVSARAKRRPVDEALPLLLTDSRRVKRQLMDALHVRVVDVPAALRARAYEDSAGFTVEVHDDLLDANDGTWRVEVAPEGASVEPAAASEADLRMGITELGALYMGDVRVSRLAAAGLVDVLNPSVLRTVDTAFSTTEAGWVPEVW